MTLPWELRSLPSSGSWDPPRAGTPPHRQGPLGKGRTCTPGRGGGRLGPTGDLQFPGQKETPSFILPCRSQTPSPRQGDPSPAQPRPSPCAPGRGCAQPGAPRRWRRRSWPGARRGRGRERPGRDRPWRGHRPPTPQGRACGPSPAQGEGVAETPQGPGLQG